jgi:hypothetical protein
MLRRIAAGEKHVDIAKSMNISPVTVSIANNSEICKATLKELQAKRDEKVLAVKEKMAELGVKSAEILETVLYDDNAQMAMRVKVAERVLTSIGVDAPKRVEGEVTTKVVDADMLREIKKTALDMAKEAGIIPVGG